MVLKREEILKEIAKGKIVIEPFDEKAIKDASIELSLGAIGIFGELKDKNGPIIIDPYNPPLSAVHRIPFVKSKYPLMPNERVVGETKEKITLPSEICGWLTPRARTSIYELNLSISSGFIQPGITEEKLFFLITNVGRVNVLLRPDIKIIQLILIKLL